MRNISSKAAKGIAILITALTFLYPAYLFAENIKVQAKSGWSYYEEKMGALPAGISKIKEWDIMAGFEEAGTEVDSAGSVSPIGDLIVTSSRANIRSTPEVPEDQESNIIYTANEGQELAYYDVITADSGGVWYMLIHEETGEECWISELTVKVIE
jgi:hypothetical protein